MANVRRSRSNLVNSNTYIKEDRFVPIRLVPNNVMGRSLAMRLMSMFYETDKNISLKNVYYLDNNKTNGGKIMEPPRLIVKKDTSKQKALEKHARLSRLFREDRFAFERERKRMIDEVISRAGDEKLRERLRALQESWDKKMKGAGSGHNRFILAQTLFWEHFHETWQPNIQKLNAILNGGSDGERSP